MRMTQIKMTIVVLYLVSSCCGYAGQISLCAPQDVGMSAEKLGRISTAVQGLVDDEKIAGASVLVARKGKVVFFETFGMMDKEAGKRVEEDTIFRFYSMTKPVTSVAVMMLYEQGRIELDDPVSKYIESFKDLKVYGESGTPVEPAREMTIRDLLRHTSGLTYGFFGNTAVDQMYREKGVLDRETSLDDMARKLSEIPLLYQPGTRWHYSVSTDVLGHLIEKVSGESLDAFFRSRIFRPLGMEDTAFYVPPEKVDRLAVCYSPRLGKGLRISDNPRASQFLEKPGLPSGGGGLVSTVGDYLQFCRMLVNKGELDGRRLLRSETVEMMTQNQLPASVSWNGQGFGLGFSVQVTEGRYGAGEYGWGGAASTHFWISPRHELIVIALSQLMPYSSQLADAVKPLVYDSISKVTAPSIDIWTAAGQGNLEAIEQHVSTGTDLNAKEPAGGSTPLIVAALFGQTKVATLLIEKGAEVHIENNDGATPLHAAAFFGHTEMVKLLLDRGADSHARNIRGETPLDIVAGPWSRELEGVYRYVADLLQIQLDLERIRAVRPKIAAILRKHGDEAGSKSRAEAVTPTGLRGAYARNGRLHVGVFGAPDGEPITTGPADMKPSWSKTGDMLVFFRVTKWAPDIPDWKTAICVINADGTGFRKLTDGTHTDFNPTWTRDGSNLAVLNRQKPNKGYVVMLAKPDGEPGEEYPVSDTSQHTYAYSCLKDGRILVSSSHRPGGYFLMTPAPEGKATYESIQCDLARQGLLDRISIAPGETRVCFEFQEGFGAYRYPGRTLYIADFDAKTRTIANPQAIANEASDRDTTYLYPRWTKDESAVVYHCNKTGKNQLYMHRLADGSTIRVSADADADYMFPHGEDSPK